jgi:Gnt-I system high-affinity gluconate transporter
MTFILLLASIVLLIVLVTALKLHTFLSFLVVCFFLGWLSGLNTAGIVEAIQKGIGNILGFLTVIIILGAMLGKIIADSGAAQRITFSLVHLFGKKGLQWAVMITAFLTGIPLFYEVGFMLLIPLIISIAQTYQKPVLYIAIPALAALSVTHGFLPPHPAPTALVQQLNANMGITLLYGLTIAIPTVIVAGPLFSKLLPKHLLQAVPVTSSIPVNAKELPAVSSSLLSAFLPVLLIAAGSLVSFTSIHDTTIGKLIEAVGQPFLALLISVLAAFVLLGMQRGKSMNAITVSMDEAIKNIAKILLIIGGAGAFKQLLSDSGMSEQIVNKLQHIPVHPLLLVWSISAALRICIGSATVAALTTGGIVAPMIATANVNPNLMVLAIGSGSIIFSHVNDPGFWMFKEYFNLTIKQTLQTWSVMETVISIMGLIGVLVLSYFL